MNTLLKKSEPYIKKDRFGQTDKKIETPKMKGVWDKYEPQSALGKMKGLGSKLYDLVGVNIDLKGKKMTGGFGTPGSAKISGLGKNKDWSVGVWHDRTNPWQKNRLEPKSKLGFNISKKF